MESALKAFLVCGGLFIGAVSHASDLTKMPFDRLCAKVRAGDTTALEELVRRKALPVDEIAYVAAGQVFIGMSDGGARCALGEAVKVNKTITARGTRLQVVFGSGRILYIENGRIIAIQH